MPGDSIVVELNVTDNEGLMSETQQFEVTINNKNLAPVAEIVSADNINEGEPLTISAMASNDADGEVSQYLWTQISGPDININNSITPDYTVMVPSVPSGGDVIVIQLVVIDNQGLESSVKQKHIDVNNVNIIPFAVIDTIASVTEGMELTFDAGASNDEDGSIAQFNWSQLSCLLYTSPSPRDRG